MAIAVQVTVDERSLKEAAYILRAVPRAMPRVLRRAINRTVDMAATDLKRRTGEQIAIKKGEIAKGISKKHASFADLSGSVGAKPYRPSLTEFPGTRQSRRGVIYRISRAEGRKMIEHGFIATMASGHRGVFLRARFMHGKFIPMKSDSKREAIYETKGPSIWQIITGTPGLLKAVTDTAGSKLGKNIDDQIGVELRRWKNR